MNRKDNALALPLIMRVVLLFVVLCGASFFFVKGQYFYFAYTLPFVVLGVILLYQQQRKAYEELSQFVDCIKYRDFSRHFDVTHAPANLKPFRDGFNEIINAFKLISREKETQYQYLQKILELVHTGILLYNNESGEIKWMNESLKQMLKVPYLKTIHSLANRDEGLYKQILELKPSVSKVGTARVENYTIKMLLSATAFETNGETFKLVAFQNAEAALDDTEAKAWQKLLRVMTHEIMNSIAPISSLAETLQQRLQEMLPLLPASATGKDDLLLGIETIRRRSEGLHKFAETYRNLNKVNSPRIKPVQVENLFENLAALMQPMLDQKGITMEVALKNADLAVNADNSLIEQVLINLLVNSMEALKDTLEPKIVLSAYLSDAYKTVIKVADNGTGMTGEIMEKIFIPFFTTKKNGSGIGLSLCKQIMMLHHGNIQVQSLEGKGTSFMLLFDQ